MFKKVLLALFSLPISLFLPQQLFASSHVGTFNIQPEDHTFHLLLLSVIFVFGLFYIAKDKILIPLLKRTSKPSLKTSITSKLAFVLVLTLFLSHIIPCHMIMSAHVDMAQNDSVSHPCCMPTLPQANFVSPVRTTSSLSKLDVSKPDELQLENLVCSEFNKSPPLFLS